MRNFLTLVKTDGSIIKDGRKLRCGFDYFPIPAPESRSPKLTKHVLRSSVCLDEFLSRWRDQNAVARQRTLFFDQFTYKRPDLVPAHAR